MEKPELPRYRCHKVVQAAKIAWIECGRRDRTGPGATLLFGASIGPDCVSSISVSETYMGKHNPQPGGYYVRYEDGYESYSPAEAFESGYRLIESTGEPEARARVLSEIFMARWTRHPLNLVEGYGPSAIDEVVQAGFADVFREMLTTGEV